MQFLKTTVDQIRDLYLGLTPGLRIIAGLLTSVLVMSLLFLVSSNGSVTPRPTDTMLLNGYYFNQTEQNTVAAALAKENLTAHTWENGRLRVPLRQEAAYIDAINKAGAIPRGAQAVFASWLNNTSVFESKMLMQGRIEASTAEAVGMALEKQFVDLERVSVFPRTETKRQGINSNKVTSVSVVVRGELDARKKGVIAATVKGAFNIDDMSLITIADDKGGYTASEDWLINSDGAFLAKQIEAEMYWESKIRGVLSMVDGLVVKTSVQLDPRKNLQRFTVEHDRERPTNDVYTKDESQRSEGKVGGVGSRPGYAMQVNTPLPLNNGWAFGSNEFKENFSSSEAVKAIQGTEARFEEASNIPRSISAAIQIPTSYFRRIWMESHQRPGEVTPEPTPEELAAFQAEQISEMKKTVITLIKNNISAEYINGLDVNSMVDIRPYNKTEPASVVVPLTFSQVIVQWFSENWKTLGLFTLVFVALALLWVVSKPAKPEPIIIYEAAELPRTEQPRKQRGDEFEDEDEETAINRTLEPFSKSMRSLQEEVSDLVAENPDAAANVLRQWIGKVVAQEH